MLLRRSFGSRAPAWVAVPGLILALGSGCHGGPPEVVEPAWLPGTASTLPTPVEPFSGERALEESRLLARHPDRLPGTRDTARARQQIQSVLREIGAPGEEWTLAGAGAGAGRGSTAGGGSARALVAELPGQSDDVLMLVARYDVDRDRADDARERVALASGPAVLLELGRALAARPRPYTVWLAFLEGGGDTASSTSARPAGAGSDAGEEALVSRFPGAAALVDALAARGDLARLRLVVYLDGLARPDLHVARDLRSHRIHRETFWESARALDLQDVFAADEPFSSPETAHRALLARDLRSVVAIVGSPPAERGPEDEAPIDEATERAATTARLDELGTVVLDALDRIAGRLSRIDGFATAPLSGGSDAGGATGADRAVDSIRPATSDDTSEPGTPEGSTSGVAPDAAASAAPRDPSSEPTRPASPDQRRR